MPIENQAQHSQWLWHAIMYLKEVINTFCCVSIHSNMGVSFDTVFKGDSKQRCHLVGKQRECKCVFICRLHLVVLSVVTERALFCSVVCFSTEFLRHSHAGLSFTSVESRERLAHDVCYTSATHASLVHHIKDTGCLTQNGSCHSRIFRTLKCWLSEGQVFMWSSCLLDLGTDFLVGNKVFVWDV